MHWLTAVVGATVDHNILAARKFRECAGTSTKKITIMQKKAAVYFNNVICYESAANGPGVPVEILSIRGPAAVKVTCENTEAANPFVVV